MATPERKRGRPQLGAALVEHLEGSGMAKERLEAILKNLRGEITAVEAAESIGVSQSGFHKIRQQALQACLDRLEPQLKGPRRNEEEDARIEELEQTVEELELALEAAEIRLQLKESNEDLEAYEAERLQAYEEEQKKLKARQLRERRKKEKKKRKRR